MRKALRESIQQLLDSVTEDTTKEQVYNRIKEEPIRRAYIELYREVGAYFALKTTERWKRSSHAFQMKDAWVDIWMQNLQAYVVNRLNNRIVSVTQTTRELIWDAITEIKGTEGISVVTTNIQNKLTAEAKKIERWRAMRIAATEVMTASNRGGYEAARQSGVEMVKSWSTGGSNIRDSHLQAEADNQSVPMDKPFVVSGIQCEAPGDGNLPVEEVVNCKCFVIYDPI